MPDAWLAKRSRAALSAALSDLDAAVGDVPGLGNRKERVQAVHKLVAALFPKVGEEKGKRCDTAVMHGPGHQSISPCRFFGKHEMHESEDKEFRWTDADVGEQTGHLTRYEHDNATGRRTKGVKRTYRLASTGAMDDKLRDR